jgi:PadR family transcriptional regulator PadR
MPDRAQILPGTLDLLILKAVSLGPLYGYGRLEPPGRRNWLSA